MKLKAHLLLHHKLQFCVRGSWCKENLFKCVYRCIVWGLTKGASLIYKLYRRRGGALLCFCVMMGIIFLNIISIGKTATETSRSVKPSDDIFATLFLLLLLQVTHHRQSTWRAGGRRICISNVMSRINLCTVPITKHTLLNCR